MSIPETVLIQSLGNRVGGIARPDGFPAIFVKNALPGELVKIDSFRVKKNFIEAELVSIEDASPHRVKPFCMYFGICGGCSLQHLNYGEQLKWKKNWVEKAIRNIPTPPVEETAPSPETAGYRNRVTFDICRGKLTLHAFRGDPVQVTSCPLMNKS
ncbi:MAG: class I SAM-dependent RNA methyltransferase, partial [bacterium]|nr:class I SAM-dependent RNA methyltransferase [bacterium]